MWFFIGYTAFVRLVRFGFVHNNMQIYLFDLKLSTCRVAARDTLLDLQHQDECGLAQRSEPLDSVSGVCVATS